MTDDAVKVVQTLFSVIWRIFTSWYIPGTNVTPAVMALFLASAGIGLRLLIRFGAVKSYAQIYLQAPAE